MNWINAAALVLITLLWVRTKNLQARLVQVELDLERFMKYVIHGEEPE